MSKKNWIWLVNDFNGHNVNLFSTRDKALDFCNIAYEIGIMKDCVKNECHHYNDYESIIHRVCDTDDIDYISEFGPEPNDFVAEINAVSVPSATRKCWWVYEDDTNGYHQLCSTKNEMLEYARKAKKEYYMGDLDLSYGSNNLIVGTHPNDGCDEKSSYRVMWIQRLKIDDAVKGEVK